MIRKLSGIAAIAALLLVLGGCSKNGSSSSPPANGLTVTPGDGRVTVNFVASPGVDYWLWYNLGNTVSTTDGTGTIIQNIVPGQVIEPLNNEVNYTFTMNGRKNGGPAGANTPPVTVMTKIAGATWQQNVPLGSNNLLALNWNVDFVATGTNGSIYTSADGVSWSADKSGVSADLNAVTLNSTADVCVAVGAGGAVVTSQDLINWTVQNSGFTNNLYGVTPYNATATFVAVGSNGTILYSATNGVSWVAENSGTTNDLYGVAYSTSIGFIIAVGANGTILTSVDGVTWTPQTSHTTANLRSVTLGVSFTPTLTAISNLLVAVGDSGTIVTSPDGVNWTVQTTGTSNSLTSVTADSQFVAVGAAGTILTSLDGVTWTPQVSGTSNNLNAVYHDNFNIPAAFSYNAVGNGGVNLSAF